MSDMNSVLLSGRLTKDAEYKVTPNGFQILSFSIASDKYAKKDDKKTLFVDCVIIGKYADAMNGKLKKGLGIVVMGELDVDQWEDKNTGQKRVKPKIVVDKIRQLSTTSKDVRDDVAEVTGKKEEFTDDIPF